MVKQKVRVVTNRRTQNTDQANLFHYYWSLLVNHPELNRLEIRDKEHGGEIRFAQEFNGRRWQFDVAFPEILVAVEIDGGRVMCRFSPKQNRYIAVGHPNTDDDLEKHNTALMLGWAVFHFSPGMLNKNPEHCINQVAIEIRRRLSDK